MSRFRPCIDLRGGRVVQIVGATLTEKTVDVNFTADEGAGHFAARYRDDGLTGGHVIALGPGNEDAAREALAAFPGGLQYGGGVDPGNARGWIEAGASAVVVTSFLFDGAALRMDRLESLARALGPSRVVLDLSCRRFEDGYRVMSERWKTRTDLALTAAKFRLLADFCGEFLVHAVAVEGLQGGIDGDLTALLGDLCPLPVTYAGGIASMRDVDEVERRGAGRVDYTVGSALDLFGGRGLRYDDLVRRTRGNPGG